MEKDIELAKISILNCEKIKEKTFQGLRIEEDSFFKGFEKKDIFLFAMAIGVKEKSRLSLSERKGWTRMAYLSPEDEWLMKVVAIKTKESLDILDNPKEIINIAEEYANGGIDYIKKKMDSNSKYYATELHEDLYDIVNLKKHGINQNGGISSQNINEKERNLTLNDYLKKGESDNIEYKSSLGWDYVNDCPNKNLEKVIIKVITSFLNSDGGVLLIGVDDDGDTLGIERDLKIMKDTDKDHFFQKIINLIKVHLGIQYIPYIKITFEKDEEKNEETVICLVVVEPSKKPVYYKDKDNKEFYIRAGNTTRLCNTEEAVSYIDIHW